MTVGRYMKKLFYGILIVLSLAGCGAWVRNYDQEANRLISVDVNPNEASEIALILRSFAREHNLQIVVQDKSSHEEGAFNVMMRNKSFAVFCTNFPIEKLQCGIHKSRIEKNRPSDSELNAFVEDLRIQINTLQAK